MRTLLIVLLTLITFTAQSTPITDATIEAQLIPFYTKTSNAAFVRNAHLLCNSSKEASAVMSKWDMSTRTYKGESVPEEMLANLCHHTFSRKVGRDTGPDNDHTIFTKHAMYAARVMVKTHSSDMVMTARRNDEDNSQLHLNMTAKAYALIATIIHRVEGDYVAAPIVVPSNIKELVLKVAKEGENVLCNAPGIMDGKTPLMSNYDINTAKFKDDAYNKDVYTAATAVICYYSYMSTSKLLNITHLKQTPHTGMALNDISDHVLYSTLTTKILGKKYVGKAPYLDIIAKAYLK